MSGGFLSLEGVRKEFEGVVAVDTFNLDVAPGEFVSFLGPSGCGKTTTLRMVAGFEQPTSGTIRLGGKDVTHAKPNQRNIGMVFQSYALFPNMTVADNIGFGLTVRKESAAARQDRVKELLDLIHLPDKGKAYPYELSGGQQQRVALAPRWPFVPSSCCWTSRSRLSTPRFETSSGPRSDESSSSSTSPLSTSLTIRRRRWRFLIGSS